MMYSFYNEFEFTDQQTLMQFHILLNKQICFPKNVNESLLQWNTERKMMFMEDVIEKDPISPGCVRL